MNEARARSGGSRLRRPALCVLVAAAVSSLAVTQAGATSEGAAAHAATAGRSVACEPASTRALRAGAAAPRTYDDLIEDSGSAPDFCAANLITNDNETITIGIHVHNRSGFAAGDQYGIFVDADRNASTGNEGADYLLVFDGDGASLLRWDGSSFATAPSQRPVVVQWVSGYGPVVQIGRADLGNVSAFDFVLASVLGEESDFAPDAGFWSYGLTPLTLTARSLTIGPARAGRTFTARMSVTRSDFDAALTEGTITCTARLGGRTLRGQGSFAGGRVVCTWRLPRNARGKRLTGSVTVSLQGAQASRTFSVLVR